ncbi:hypothetical protein MAR_013243, partial [Mya arenaria]
VYHFHFLSNRQNNYINCSDIKYVTILRKTDTQRSKLRPVPEIGCTAVITTPSYNQSYKQGTRQNHHGNKPTSAVGGGWGSVNQLRDASTQLVLEVSNGGGDILGGIVVLAKVVAPSQLVLELLLFRDVVPNDTTDQKTHTFHNQSNKISWTQESLKAYKSLDGNNFIHSGHVQEVFYYEISPDSSACLLKTKVTPSQRLRDKLHEP